MLEDEADLALAHVPLRGILAVEEHAALVLPLQPRDDPQQRRLAAARRAEQGDQLPRGEVERHVVEGDEPAERLPDPLNLDAHEGSPSPATSADLHST